MNVLRTWFKPCVRRKSTSTCPKWLKSIDALDGLKRLADLPVHESHIPQLMRLSRALDIKPIRTPATNGQVGYIPLIEASRFTLCAFFLPKGTLLPYHDHPGMHVALRVLSGEMEVRSVDIQGLVTIGCEYEVKSESAVLVSPRSDICIVRPDKANLHQITALTDSMFLDFVVPPYSYDRSITYFKRTRDSLTAVRERDVDLYMQYCDVNNHLD